MLSEIIIEEELLAFQEKEKAINDVDYYERVYY